MTQKEELTQVQIEAINKIFNEIDADKNGEISQKEFIDYFNDKNSTMKSSNDFLLKLVFHVIDKDNSGSIDKDEFTVFGKYYLKSLIEQQRIVLKTIYNVVDGNGDGNLQPEELTSIYEAMDCESFANDPRSALECFDKDGNGIIDFEEFCSMMRDVFA